MNEDHLMDSFGRIDDEVIQKVNLARGKRRNKPNIRRWISLAACFVLIVSAALTAEATNGTVSNLLAPLFGGAQTEIVDKIGVPIGASTSVNGYTLTADAIIGDRYSVLIAYTLTRDDGQPLPENIDYQHRKVWASGYGTRMIIDDNKNRLILIEDEEDISKLEALITIEFPFISISMIFLNASKKYGVIIVTSWIFSMDTPW